MPGELGDKGIRQHKLPPSAVCSWHVPMKPSQTVGASSNPTGWYISPIDTSQFADSRVFNDAGGMRYHTAGGGRADSVENSVRAFLLMYISYDLVVAKVPGP